MSNAAYLIIFIFCLIIGLQILGTYIPAFNDFLLRFVAAVENTVFNIIPRLLELWRKIKEFRFRKKSTLTFSNSEDARNFKKGMKIKLEK